MFLDDAIDSTGISPSVGLMELTLREAGFMDELHCPLSILSNHPAFDLVISMADSTYVLIWAVVMLG